MMVVDCVGASSFHFQVVGKVQSHLGTMFIRPSKRVSFQIYIPKLQSVIKSSNENVLAIRRELGEWIGGTIILNEHLQESTSVGGSNFAGIVVTTGDNERSVMIEMDGGDRHGMDIPPIKSTRRLLIPFLYDRCFWKCPITSAESTKCAAFPKKE